jgi:uncharacterized protein (DUF1684 family)
MSEYTEELEVERTMKDRFMAAHPESPFVQERVPGFQGLHYFAPDESMRVPARLERRALPEEAYLRTNRDGQAAMRYIGDLRFRVGTKSLSLRVYHAGEGVGTSVFVPFRDLTSGTESYGPGRYLTFDLTEDDAYDLDFNRAFNPYCAYTDAFECGFPPAENDLPVAIRAGEQAWAVGRNPRTPSSVVRALRPTRLSEGRQPPARAAPGRSPRAARKPAVPPRRSRRPARR